MPVTKPDPLLGGNTSLTDEYLNIELHKFMDSRDKSIAEINTTERSLCSQLMLVNTVLITVNIVVLGNVSQIKNITGLDKTLLLVGFGFLSLSIFAGIKYYFEIISFNRKWAVARNKVVKNIASLKYNSAEEMTPDIIKIQSRLPNENNRRYMNLQIGLMGAALIVYFLLITLILFSLHVTVASR